MKPLAVCLVVGAVLGGSSAARAQAPAKRRIYHEPPLASEPATTVERYGYQIAIVNAAFVAATPLHTGLSPALYLLGGPLVHLAHGQVRMGSYSLGLRISLPLAGFFGLRAASGKRCNSIEGPFCSNTAAVVGTAIGLAAAMVLDWTLLARKTTTQPSLFEVGNVRANPNLGVTRDGVSLGLSGSF